LNTREDLVDQLSTITAPTMVIVGNQDILTPRGDSEEIAERIRRSEGPIELVDSQGHTIGVVRRPPTETDIQRARERASKDGKRLTWAQVAAKIREGAAK
jgi:pimeloyl-ACP methyl ester carboxylesterase